MCTFIICLECFFILTLTTLNTGLICLFPYDFFLGKPRKYKKSISFIIANYNMSTKIVGWLVGSWDAKILELGIKSLINKKKIFNKSSVLFNIVIRIFEEFPGFSKLQEIAEY